MQHLVRKAHRREFESAPQVESGEWVAFERLDPKNDAWFFGQDTRNVAGYFPVAWFELKGARALARRPYHALELTVAADEPIEIQETHGRWLLVTNARGEQGWIPQECLE